MQWGKGEAPYWYKLDARPMQLLGLQYRYHPDTLLMDMFSSRKLVSGDTSVVARVNQALALAKSLFVHC